MKKIQIALVSKETLPVFYLINELRPDEVFLIGTLQTAREMDIIESISKKIGIPCHKLTTKADDVQDCMQRREKVHLINGDDCDYCYNLTCGTKLMAFGAMICSQRHHARAVYAGTDSYIYLSDFEKHSFSHLLDTETIISLQGQKVKGKTLYHYDADRTACANEIRNFIENHIRSYGILMKQFLQYQQLPNPFESGKLRYYRRNGRLTVEYDDVEVFSSDYPGVFTMLFEGRWWETQVADAIAKWAGKDKEIWTGVRFEPNDKMKGNDKNEIDVLVNIGNALLFVECKSGSFSQDNIYKLSSVFKTYGSYKSKGVIVSYRNNAIKPDFVEKARDERVDLIAPSRGMGDLPKELDIIVKSLKS